MSLIRSAFVIAVVVMLLPSEEKKQAELTNAATRTIEQTATFCERNPSTCSAGREMWTLFVQKAEYGMELGARLLREQIAKGLTGQSRDSMPSSTPTPRSEVFPAYAQQPAEPQQRRNVYTMDNPSRWR